MVSHNGITGSVVVDGAALPEYATQYSAETNELSCWIPSEAGKKFRIHIRRDRTNYHCRNLFLVDGRCIRSMLNSAHNADDMICKGARTSATTQCSLLFSKTVLTDDAALLGSEATSTQGDIRIEHWETQISKGPWVPRERSYAANPTKVVHESAKPIPHIACFGKERTYQPQTIPDDRYRNIECLLTIIFHYRPLEYLQARGIAPRPTPLRPIAPPSTNEDEHREDARPQKHSRSPKKRKAALEREVIDFWDTESEGEPAASGSGSQNVDEGGDDDMAQINRLRAELEIKRMELRLADLEERHRKKRRLNGEASGSQGAKRASVASVEENAAITKREAATPIKKENC